MILNDLPIFNALIKYREKEIIPFHIPGHKLSNIYKKLGMEDLLSNLLSYDVTEVPGIDNLHFPEESILEAQKLAAKAFYSDHTFFLINGTTVGIHAMILGTTSPGDSIIIPRNCHKSVLGAIILGKLKPIYINPEVDTKTKTAAGVSPYTVEMALKSHPEARVCLITSPTYYGVCSDLEKIAQIVHREGKILLVDEAHGAHFTFCDSLPKPAILCGADIVAQSTHKTLPSMTQSSMLHIKSDRVDIDRVKFYLELLQSTSPSHVLLAFLDTARHIMQKHGNKLLNEVIEYSNTLRDSLNKVSGLYCISSDAIGSFGIDSIDPTRLTVNFCELSICAKDVDKHLRDDYNIQVELSDLYNIVAVGTVGDEREWFLKFDSAIKKVIDKKDIVRVEKESIEFFNNYCKLGVLPYVAVEAKKESIDIKNSIGRISAELIMPYPPGIPLIMPGEYITKELIDYVFYCKKSGINITGLKDRTVSNIMVLK